MIYLEIFFDPETNLSIFYGGTAETQVGGDIYQVEGEPATGRFILDNGIAREATIDEIKSIDYKNNRRANENGYWNHGDQFDSLIKTLKYLRDEQSISLGPDGDALISMSEQVKVEYPKPGGGS